MRDVRAERIASRLTPQSSGFVALPCAMPRFACPFTATGIDLYALAYTAARITAEEAQRVTDRRRMSAACN